MKFTLLSALLVASSHAAVVISEFEPNPAGGDPPDTTFELAGGTPLEAFDYWILSVENDGFNGAVDRAAQVTGSFDANGLAVVTTPDLENPSNTVVLLTLGAGAADPVQGTDDLDPANDGVLVIPTGWNVVDAVGVSDSANDDASLYGELLGGSNILYNGEFEPLVVFRDGSTGDWFQSVTVDFGSPDQRIGTFAATGGPELGDENFSVSPDAPTFGAVNGSFTAVPEPSTALLGGLGLLALIRRRR